MRKEIQFLYGYSKENLTVPPEVCYNEYQDLSLTNLDFRK